MWLACRDSQSYCVIPSEATGLFWSRRGKPRGGNRVFDQSNGGARRSEQLIGEIWVTRVEYWGRSVESSKEREKAIDRRACEGGDRER